MDSTGVRERRSLRILGISICGVLSLPAFPASLGLTTRLPTTPAWYVQANKPYSALGASVAAAGDIDGDGFDDILVGAPLYDTATRSDAGAAFLYRGSSAGPSLVPAWTYEGNNTSGGNLGRQVAGVGDVNGDGFADLLVGEPGFTQGQSREGQALLFLGSASGPAASPSWSVQSDQAGAELGKVVAQAGDVNGDGFDDLLVTAPSYNLGPTDNGIVRIYHGSASGVATTPTLTIPGEEAGLFFGGSAAGAGDVNGDGFDDVIVGTINYHTPTITWAGRVYLFFGSSSGLAATPAWTFTGTSQSSGLGQSVAGAGDVNGDGYADVLVGADRNDNGNVGSGGTSLREGTVFLFLGGAAGLSSAPSWSVQGSQHQERFGFAVAGAGDIDGDGYADIAVGSLTFNNSEVTGAAEGAAFLYLGSATTPTSSTAWSVVGTQPDGTFGSSVSGAGDPDGDGLANLLVGWPGYDEGQFDEGAAVLYFGPTVPIPCIDVDGDGFGNPGDPTCSNGGATDCDDASATVWPGAPETCNSVDDNCNSSVDEGYPLGQECLVGTGLCARTGSRVCDPGGATTICGNATPGPSTPEICDGFDNNCNAQVDEGLTNPDGCRIVASPVTNARLGTSVDAAGDVNGDGFADLIVGVPGAASQRGEVWLLRGAAAGLQHDPLWIAGPANPPPFSRMAFGSSVAGVGDVDQDGFSDLLVGAPFDDPNQYGFDWRGAAYLYRGSASAPTLAWIGHGTIEGEMFGGAVAGTGDLNGDSHPDVVVVAAGKPFLNSTHLTRAYVYSGNGSGLPASPTWTYLAGATHLNTVSAAGAGDVNGDGFGDLILGSVSSAPSLPGVAALHLGGPSGPAGVAAWTGEGQFAEPSYGRSVAAAGDVNGDGFGDILIGAPGAAYPGYPQGAPGKVYLYLGSSQGPATTPAWIATSSGTDDAFGSTVASGGDVNEDGFDDILISAPSFDDDHPDEGRAYLFLGGAAGPATSPAWSSSPGNQQHALSGFSMATTRRIGGSGTPEIVIGSPEFDSGGSPMAGRIDLFASLDLDVDDVWGVADNCPFAANPDQSDVDADSLGDVCDCAPTVPGTLPPGPVTGSLQGGHGLSVAETFVSWPQPAGATHSNTYRGTIPTGLMGSRPGAIYDHGCYESADVLGDGPLISTDLDVPEPGTAFYYLVTSENGCGEGPFNGASDGSPRPTLSACPSPP